MIATNILVLSFFADFVVSCGNVLASANVSGAVYNHAPIVDLHSFDREIIFVIFGDFFSRSPWVGFACAVMACHVLFIAA